MAAELIARANAATNLRELTVVLAGAAEPDLTTGEWDSVYGACLDRGEALGLDYETVSDVAYGLLDATERRIAAARAR